jgi:hypothetical protein
VSGLGRGRGGHVEHLEREHPVQPEKPHVLAEPAPALQVRRRLPWRHEKPHRVDVALGHLVVLRVVVPQAHPPARGQGGADPGGHFFDPVVVRHAGVPRGLGADWGGPPGGCLGLGSRPAHLRPVLQLCRREPCDHGLAQIGRVKHDHILAEGGDVLGELAHVGEACHHQIPALALAVRPVIGSHRDRVPPQAEARARPDPEHCGVVGQAHLDGPRPPRIPVQVSRLLQRAEVVGDTRRAGQADRIADLPL